MASPISTLNGGFALVTGAASGIGQETVFSLAQAGVEGILLVDLDLEKAESTISESKKFATHSSFRAIAVQTDVTDEKSVDNAVEVAKKEFGRIDHCVHSAGVPDKADAILKMGNLSGAVTEHLNIEMYDKTMAVNARSTMLVLRAVSGAMAAQEPLEYTSFRHGTKRSLVRGSIVIVCSVNGLVAAPGMLNYSASKWAVIGIAKTAAVDNIKNHIRVNIVCPAWTQTPMMEKSLVRVPQLGPIIQAVSPLKRGAFPEEVADSILFLCSPASSYINGSVVNIDAGLTLTVQRGPA
ncbi:SDR family NAD(P)-dependent oxidoreductase [Aspergillus affinis]|uniref:SDR family NAD(P)-dependent oxidoreductase n=1 Tax=Aspergillus affinis TaxID=1070780 RepID=UPI0022FEF947|nr:uncharacterized protein KD926_005182 [Aspergillus affinis]KAI9034860.1 hypothetical protein KD926_005182 [Aspergillus affinis]